MNGEDYSVVGAERDASPVDEQAAIERETRSELELGRAEYEAYAKMTGDEVASFDDVVDMRVKFAVSIYHRRRTLAELTEHSVVWDRISREEAATFDALLDKNPDELRVHRFLEENPKFLVQGLGGGHGRYQISKKRLGSEYVPDFLIAHEHSFGVEWHAVEIESPKVRPYRKDGLQSSKLTHALGQVRDWRAWLESNRDYARRPRNEGGLGLMGIDSRVAGVILIGRRDEFPERYNELRRQLRDNERIVIHSYDWLVDIGYSNRSGMLSSELQENDPNAL